MNSVVKELVYQLITRFRIPQLLHRRLFWNELTILMYHAVIRFPLNVYNGCFLDEFLYREQMNYIKKNFDVIQLSEAVDRMKNGRIYRPTAVITFDDGFQNNYDICFPILRELHLPATIFLNTRYIDTSDTVWFCKLNRAMAKTTKSSLEWNGCRFDLTGMRHRVVASDLIQESLKQFPQPRLLRELSRIILNLGDDPDCPIEIDSPYRMLGHQAITEMASSGLIEFGAHTHTHAILSRLPPQKRLDEIERSLVVIHKLTGHPCKLFAYPNGGVQDYNIDTIKILQARGVHAAVTSIEGPNDSRTPVMELKRHGISADLSHARFQMKVHHVISKLQQLVQLPGRSPRTQFI